MHFPALLLRCYGQEVRGSHHRLYLTFWKYFSDNDNGYNSALPHAIDKLADYVMYETKYDKREAEYMLKDLGTVIFMKNFKVCEISELDGWDNTSQHIKYKQIYKRPEF